VTSTDGLVENVRVADTGPRASDGHPDAASTSRAAHLNLPPLVAMRAQTFRGYCVGRGHVTFLVTVGGTRVVACGGH
jgi:hypothetical protein